MTILKPNDQDPFPSLTPFSYDFIMADPPWHFRNWSAKGEEKNAVSHYQCMALEDIKSLPVSHLARKDCVLMLWATAPMIREALEVMESWCFDFKTMGYWHKTTKHGKQAFGTGYILRCSGEPFLIGTTGKPKTSRSCRSTIEGVIREHSRKPEAAFEFAEKLMPNAKRLELFSRQDRPGWDRWGNETGTFNKAENMQVR